MHSLTLGLIESWQLSTTALIWDILGKAPGWGRGQGGGSRRGVLDLKGLVFHGGPMGSSGLPFPGQPGQLEPCNRFLPRGLAWGAGLLSLFGIKLQ